jgi:hypothetical protein
MARRDARQSHLEKLDQEFAKDESEMVGEIRSMGFDIDSVWDFVNNQPHEVLRRRFIGSYREAYPILIRHLNVPHHPCIKEGIVRALTVKDGGAELEAALMDQFYSEKDHTLRWVLANALRTAVPYHRRRKHPEISEILKLDTVIP